MDLDQHNHTTRHKTQNLEYSKLSLEAFFSTLKTLGHRNYAFRHTQKTSNKVAKNEIFPKGRVGENISNIFATTALWENLILGNFGRSVLCWSKCTFLVSNGHSVVKKCFQATFRRFRFLRYFHHCGPFGKSNFWQVWLKCCVLV